MLTRFFRKSLTFCDGPKKIDSIVGCDNRLEGPFPGSGFRLPVPFLLEIDFLLFGSEDVPPLLLDFGILEKNKYRVKLG